MVEYPLRKPAWFSFKIQKFSKYSFNLSLKIDVKTLPRHDESYRSILFSFKFISRVYIYRYNVANQPSCWKCTSIKNQIKHINININHSISRRYNISINNLVFPGGFTTLSLIHGLECVIFRN